MTRALQRGIRTGEHAWIVYSMTRFSCTTFRQKRCKLSTPPAVELHVVVSQIKGRPRNASGFECNRASKSPKGGRFPVLDTIDADGHDLRHCRPRHAQEIVMAELEYGPVYVLRGRHKGRILYYDDDYTSKTAICYVGHPLSFCGTFDVALRFLREP